MLWGPAQSCCIAHLAEPGTSAASKQLNVCAASGNLTGLEVHHIIRGDNLWFAPHLLALSHDGAHGAGIAYQGSSASVRQLVVFCLESGRVQWIPLPFSSITQLAWSLNDDAVLVTSDSGRQDLLVQFE